LSKNVGERHVGDRLSEKDNVLVGGVMNARVSRYSRYSQKGFGMRCIAGIALFLILYFGSCSLLGEIVRTTTIRNDPRHSVAAGRMAKADVLRKYHALVAVGAGVASILACGLPTLLARRSRQDEWQN
jgi:hypothetical protein